VLLLVWLVCCVVVVGVHATIVVAVVECVTVVGIDVGIPGGIVGICGVV